MTPHPPPLGRPNSPRTRLAALHALFLVHPIGVALSLSACGEDTRTPGLGARCQPELVSACADDLVCVDGLCRDRFAPPAPVTPPLAPSATFEVVAPDTADTADTIDPEATLDTGPSPDTDAVERVTITSYDPELEADTRLALAVGQAAVMEVFIPIESRPAVLFVNAFRPDGPACGLFRPLVWLPRARPDGMTEFVTLPDIIGLARPISTVVGSPTFTALPLPEAPDDALLARAPHRVGARYEGPCTANTTAPFLLLDTSADTSRTWVWADAWIPGADLALPGRWAFALQLRVN